MEVTNTSKKNIFSQIGDVFKIHIICVGLEFIFGMFLISSLSQKPILKLICSILFILIYAIIIFLSGYDMAKYDLKSHTSTKATLIKGFLISLPLVLFTYLLLITLKLPWLSFFLNNNTTIIRFIENLPFVIWTYPYNILMKIDNDNISLTGYLLMTFIPILSFGTGYFGGYKNWDIASKVNSIIYEKNK